MQKNTRNPPPKKQIFILSSQSNMSGRGGVFKNDQNVKQRDDVVPPECLPHPSILRLTPALQWELATESLHADIDSKKTCGVGPAMPLSNAARRRVGNEVHLALVPCAVGGTDIKKWARGEELYENMVKRATPPLKRAKESVKGHDHSEIKALLWFQGESDTSTESDAEAYKANMETFIHNVREDLNLPSSPIIQVALASGFDYTERGREAQNAIDIPNVICVDAKGLALKEDHTMHLTTESQVQLGQMLAEAYLTHFHA